VLPEGPQTVPYVVAPGDFGDKEDDA